MNVDAWLTIAMVPTLICVVGIWIRVLWDMIEDAERKRSKP